MLSDGSTHARIRHSLLSLTEEVNERQAMGNETEGGQRRNTLLSRSRKGDLKAQRELMEKYGTRVYSDAERLKMPVYYDSGKKGSPPSLTSITGPVSGKHGMAGGSTGSAKNSALTKERKTTRKK